MNKLALLALLLLGAAPAPPAVPASKFSPADQAFVAYPGGDLLIAHVQLVDGTGAAPRQDVSVLVRDGRIAAIGGDGKVAAPVGTTVIDGRGKTLLPGFVMVHEHFFYPATIGGEYEEYPYSFSRLYLAGGTTTLRTGGSLAPYADINTARAIARGEQPGPDMDATGPYLEGPRLLSAKMAGLKDAADAARTVDFWAGAGATSFKAYNFITRAELQAAIDAAHRRGLKITGHLCSVTYAEAAAMGIDNLEHSFAVATDFVAGKRPDQCPPQNETVAALAALDPDGPEIGALMKTLIARHVALTSTLTVFETFTPGRPEAPDVARALLTPPLRQSYEARWTAIQAAQASPWAAFLPKLMWMERRFVAMGGTLLAGTDPTGYGGVVPGWSARRQVQLLVEGGFTFPDALKIATLNGARYLGREREVGSVEVGKRADLILIDGDPVRDPAALDRMPFVFKAGVGYGTQAIFDALKGVVGLY
ncbi:MAG TPA: amidohydrolase family protein [Allosphingosinicella sp.]|jgi:enamidase